MAKSTASSCGIAFTPTLPSPSTVCNKDPTMNTTIPPTTAPSRTFFTIVGNLRLRGNIALNRGGSKRRRAFRLQPSAKPEHPQKVKSVRIFASNAKDKQQDRRNQNVGRPQRVM